MGLAIKVQGLGKYYRLGEIGTGTLSRDLERFFSNLFSSSRTHAILHPGLETDAKNIPEINWSLKGIDFEIEQGDTVGIIGRNGAGKSTLLKIISRITAPSLGKVHVKGKVASLLEVGTGFHPELTGRENIYLNGTILGMKRKEIKRKFDEIVSFSGIDTYIDTPVKRYSSGMYVRLAFAVAAHLDAEILIVDEVLAVGDYEFQKKCLSKINEVSKNHGKTVLFVSHNMEAVKNICNTGILLSAGSLNKMGNCPDVINAYYNKSEDGNIALNANFNLANGASYLECAGEYQSFKLLSASILNAEGISCTRFTSLDDIFIQLKFSVADHYADFRVIIQLKDSNNNIILVSQMADSLSTSFSVAPGKYDTLCRIPKQLLSSQIYGIDILCYHVGRFTVSLNHVLFFKHEFVNNNYTTASFHNISPFRPLLPWTINKH